MIRYRILPLVISCGLFLDQTFELNAHHNGTRYFPFLEQTEDIAIKRRSQLSSSFFNLMASTAHRQGGGTGGIPELWGKYDLNDIITGLRVVHGSAVADAIENRMRSELRNKSIKFKVDGKVLAQGLTLGYEQVLCGNGFSFGAWVPVMHVSSTSRFNLELNGSGYLDGLPTQLATVVDDELVLNNDGFSIDRARRAAHDKLGFMGSRWEASGFGDTDVHVRWNYFMDHQCLMRSIDTYVQGGLIIPTGMMTRINEPLSLPAMGNGHWGAYFDVLPEFELKQDWKCGFIFSGLYQFKRTRNVRLPIGKEPAPYSALVGSVEIQPGVTAKLSPYFTLENLTDGVHFQIRYTYLRHSADKWFDRRTDQATIPSYLNRSISKAELTTDQIAQNIANRESMSKWRAHFFSFQVTYDSKQSLKSWVMDPLLYVTYDLPISGSGIAKTHQLSIGARLCF
jgi:hypothetical protein